jgi:hypothetical protein
MNKTLVKNSDIAVIKSKFFLYRLISYFSFLLIPVWVQKTIDLSTGSQIIIMQIYCLFMFGQWFLLGKEIDHRLKIYYRVNSTMDRIIYRLLIGQAALILIFNLYSLIPDSIVNHFFWGTWVVLGVFYSWPTRGKIIQESVSGQFGEFRYLDRFEKTILGLSVIIFLVSFPEVTVFDNIDSLKLYFDPLLKFSPQFWNFLSLNYFPFKKYPMIFKIAWVTHFYAIGIGMFLLLFYALCRYFVSRRLSLLGVFAILSSWSLTKTLGININYAISTTYSLIWIWSLLWVAKSATYRTGIFIGLIGYYGTIINQSFFILSLIQIAALIFIFFKDKNFWFKRQFFKYTIFGFSMGLVTFLMNIKNIYYSPSSIGLEELFFQLKTLFERKAFYLLSFFGVISILHLYLGKNKDGIKMLEIERQKLNQFILALLLLFSYGLFFDSQAIEHFTLMWVITLLSLLPLENIFQSMSRLRSRRNMIYVVYILICLLDSHLEGRVKVFLRLFR